MKRLLMCASPVIGVMLGMAGIVVFRQQPSADAMMPSNSAYVAPSSVQTSRPESSESTTTQRPADNRAGSSETVAKP